MEFEEGETRGTIKRCSMSPATRSPDLLKAASPVFLLMTFLLLLLSLSAPAAAQDNPETLLYAQDFEQQPLEGWQLDTGWEIVEEDSSVLSGSGHTWARLDEDPYNDMRLRFRLNITGAGRVHVNVHLLGQTRYFIGFNRDNIYLSKQLSAEEFTGDLGAAPGLRQGWQQIEITLTGPTLTVQVNDQVVMNYTDPDPLESGRVAFETLDENRVLIDDMEIWGPKPVSQGSTWIRTGGPSGGLGYDVRMVPGNPDTIYVSDGYAGVFLSRDGGDSWQPSNEGITTRKGDSQDSIPVFCLTLEPHDPDIVWVGTEHNARIFKSVDGGETWQEMTSNIRDAFFEGLTFRGFTVHPDTSDIVYTAAELHSWANGHENLIGREFEMVQGIVYRTMDGGETWQEVWRGDNLARYIWINPQNPDVIYISTGIFDREAANSDPEAGLPGGEGVLKSTDGGETWLHANQGLENLYIGSLYMNPANPDILLAGAGNNQYFQGNGIYLTTNGAATWEHMLSDQNIESVEFFEPDPSIAYAASDQMVYRSEDGGETWQEVSGLDWGPDGVRVGFPIDLQIDPRDPDRLFANAYGGGNFVSEDGGRSWQASSKGYTGAQVRALAVHPEQPAVIYAAARSGLFLSTNGGEDWTGISFPPAKVMEWNAVAVNPADPLHVASGNNWNQDLLISSDGGAAWEATYSRVIREMTGISAVVFAPSDPEILYAATSGFYSAGTFDPWMAGTGIHRSQDGGRTWESANSGLTENAGVSDLLVDPHDPQIVFAASTTDGLLLTRNGGASWAQLQNGLPEQGCRSVAFHPENTAFLLAGFERGSIYASSDGGETWQRSAHGMPPEASIRSIVFDPLNPDIVYAADIQSGVYRSTDHGAGWRLINEGLRTRAVNDLAISADGAHLYAATEGEGVYRLDLNGEPPGTAEAILPEPATPQEGLEANTPEDLAVSEEQEAAAPETAADPVSKPGLCSSVVLFPLLFGGVVLGLRRRNLLR